MSINWFLDHMLTGYQDSAINSVSSISGCMTWLTLQNLSIFS